MKLMHVRGLNRHVACESHAGGFAKSDENERFYHVKHNKMGDESFFSQKNINLPLVNAVPV